MDRRLSTAFFFIVSFSMMVSTSDGTEIRISIKDGKSGDNTSVAATMSQGTEATAGQTQRLTPEATSSSQQTTAASQATLVNSSSHQLPTNIKKSFDVDWVNNVFIKDGEPFRYVAGEMHYFRIPRQYWKDRLEKLKASGANTLQTYIEWSQHEPSNRVYRFDGQYDVAHYIRLAQQVGLNVIIRPGPYICAEREFGGYPAWLLSINPKMKLRTSDPTHTYFVARWFKYLMPQIVPLLYGNGGPIIMVQVENEYGSYPITDSNYLIWLRDLYRSYVKADAVLFTTDGYAASYLAKGRIPGVFSTVDFGGGSKMSVFDPLRNVQPNGPLVNSEYYVGWLSYWGYPYATVNIHPTIATMKHMLDHNVSFSMYMFHGGTNFAFSAGSETHSKPGSGSDKHFQADLTSYDYDAPITEAGDLTDKYYAIQELLSQYMEVDLNIKSRGMSKKGDYGSVKMSPKVRLFNSPTTMDSVISQYPLTFEQIDQMFGFVSYETEVESPSMDPSVLQINIRDRGVVYIDDEEVGVLMYTVINETPLPSTLAQGQKLRILVENMGRRNYQLLSDCTKGIISNGTIDGNIIKYWNITGYPMTTKDIEALESMEDDVNIKPPAYFTGKFRLLQGQHPLDTFLDMTGWGKGVAFINGYNLGRYWHIGPQLTLYVPGVYLKAYPEDNNVTIFELHYVSTNLEVSFTTQAKLNGSMTVTPAPPSVNSITTL